RFHIVEVVSAPFRGSICHGHMFILDCCNWSNDHLLLMTIIASRTAIELDRRVLQIRSQDAVALRDRVNLARDLHDGVLQNLSAAGLQLKIAANAVAEEHRSSINSVNRILLNAQRRIREFVQEMRSVTALQ